MADLTKKYDVLVVGGGNAALCAAISARRAGASVLVLEVATKFYRGGNTRHTRNMRCAHDAATKELTGPYSEEEFFDDLLRVTGGNTDEPLARHMIHEFEGDARLDRRAGRALPALARRHAEPRAHQLVLSRRRPGDAQRALSDRRSARRRGRIRSRGGRPRHRRRHVSLRHGAARQRRTRHGPRGHARRRLRRVRGEHRVDEAVLGRAGRQLPDPRYAAQPRHRAQASARQGRRRDRRSDPVPCGGDRRAGTEIRRRHHHAARLRGVRHRRQQAWPALL